MKSQCRTMFDKLQMMFQCIVNGFGVECGRSVTPTHTASNLSLQCIANGFSVECGRSVTPTHTASDLSLHVHGSCKSPSGSFNYTEAEQRANTLAGNFSCRTQTSLDTCCRFVTDKTRRDDSCIQILGKGQNGGGGSGDPSADGGTLVCNGGALTRINEVASDQVGEGSLGCYAAKDKIQLCLDELIVVETPAWEDISIDEDTAKFEQSAWDKISEYNQIGYDFFLPCDSHGWVGHPNSLMDVKSRRAPMLLSTMFAFTPPSLCLRPLACTFTLMDLLSFQITPCHGP